MKRRTLLKVMAATPLGLLLPHTNARISQWCPESVAAQQIATLLHNELVSHGVEINPTYAISTDGDPECIYCCQPADKINPAKAAKTLADILIDKGMVIRFHPQPSYTTPGMKGVFNGVPVTKWNSRGPIPEYRFVTFRIWADVYRNTTT